jgi:hypothetical protein
MGDERTGDVQTSGSEAVVADTKDWTWTIARACPECGFEASAVQAPEVAERVLSLTGPWPAVLSRPDVRRRPEPGVWSPLEYGCHVRDVCRVFEARVRLMLAEDDPRFENWDQDATAVQEGYAEQDPGVVAAALAEAAARASSAFDEVGEVQWDRRGLRSNGSQFTVLTLGQYFLHDLAHHLVDVGA